MSPRSSRRSTASGIGLTILLLLCLGLPAARGGIDWSVQLAAALLAALAVALAAGSEVSSIPVAALALAAVVTAMGFQLVPLPPGPLRWVSPGAAGLFEAQLQPIGLYPAARPLSLDPAATARALTTSIACLCAFGASALLSGSRPRRELLLGALALSGTAIAACGLGAAAVGLGSLLEPRLTFVNPNHLGAFLDLTAFASLGFASRAHGRARALWFIAFAVTGAGAFLSLSRGAIAAFFVGAGVFGLLYVMQARLDGRPRFLRHAAVPLAVACALAVAAYLAADPVLAEMRTVPAATQETKIQMWPLGLALALRFPLTGIGRGAFATVFPAYKVDPDPFTFTHVENEWLQAPIDLGFPAGVLLVAALAWTWLRAARSNDLSRPEIGALAGVAAVAAHDGVDFSLELLGVAVPFAVALGLLSRTQPAHPLGAWIVRWTALGAAALAVLGMAVYRSHPTEADAMRVARSPGATEAAAQARAAARWHPADYLPRAIAGVRLVQEGRCAEGLAWLGRAMVLNPTAPEPHRYAARCLAAARQDMLAKREYRLALLMGDRGALQEAMGRYPDLTDLLQIAPDSPEWLVRLGSLLQAGRPADAEPVFRRAWTEYGRLDALAGLAQTLLALGRPEECLDLAHEMQRLRPDAPAAYLLAVAALEKMGRPEDEQGELELGAVRIPGSPAMLEPLAYRALAARHFSEASRLARAIAAQSPGEVARKRMFVARVLHAEGRTAEAIGEARAARDVAPDDPATHLFLADLCASAGRYEEAIAATEAASNMPGVALGAYADRLSRLRSARQGQIESRTRQQLLGAPVR